jgi:small ubiquitin-related modifier
VKKSTKMSKIFDAYGQRRGLQATALRFMLDGERVLPDNTPKMLELEDDDQIDVMLEVVGGFIQ